MACYSSDNIIGGLLEMMVMILLYYKRSRWTKINTRQLIYYILSLNTKTEKNVYMRKTFQIN